MTAQTAPERSGRFGPVTGRLKPGNAAQAKTGPSESKPGAPATCGALCAGYGGLETAAQTVWPGLEGTP